LTPHSCSDSIPLLFPADSTKMPPLTGLKLARVLVHPQPMTRIFTKSISSDLDDAQNFRFGFRTWTFPGFNLSY
jgi:hypothetical protein